VIVATLRPGAFGGPVGHHAGRRDDEERRPARAAGRVTGVRDQGNRLQRLAESHVVGEDAAQPVVVEEAQPVEAGLLVAAQGRADTLRQGALRDAGGIR